MKTSEVSVFFFLWSAPVVFCFSSLFPSAFSSIKDGLLQQVSGFLEADWNAFFIFLEVSSSACSSSEEDAFSSR